MGVYFTRRDAAFVEDDAREAWKEKHGNRQVAPVSVSRDATRPLGTHATTVVDAVADAWAERLWGERFNIEEFLWSQHDHLPLEGMYMELGCPKPVASSGRGGMSEALVSTLASHIGTSLRPHLMARMSELLQEKAGELPGGGVSA